MPFSIAQLTLEIIKYKYLILFPVVVLEGPIVSIIAGFLASLSYLNLPIAYIVIVIADISGDCGYYSLGYWGREKFIEKWGRYVGAGKDRVDRLEKHFANNAGKTLLLGKISHGVGGAFLVAAGVAKMPFQKFLWFNFVATIPKSLLLILIGFYFGQAISKINSSLELISAISIGIAVVVGIGYLLYSPKKRVDNNNG